MPWRPRKTAFVYKKKAIKSKSRQHFSQPELELETLDIFDKLQLGLDKIGQTRITIDRVRNPA